MEKAIRHDPFDLNAQRRREQAALMATQQSEADRQRRWKRARQDAERAVAEDDAESLLRFGETLREFDCEFWLDYHDCWLDRESLRPPPLEGEKPIAETTWHSCSILSSRLLRGALTDGSEALADLDRAHTDGMVYDLDIHFGSTLALLEDWIINGGLPDTPLITQQELVDACQGGIVGFSKANVSKKMGGKLSAREALGWSDSHYRYFWHESLQREMLIRVVEFLKKQKKSSFKTTPKKSAESAPKAGRVSRKPN